MSTTYKYGPLQSDYFTTFEKLWMEGYAKEHKINIHENFSMVLSTFAKVGTDSIKTKSQALLAQAGMFSTYAKDTFAQSWNRALGYSMKKSETMKIVPLNESDVAGAKAATMWWLKEAPKIIGEKIQKGCFDNIIMECVSNDADILKKLEKFTFKDRDLIRRIRPQKVLETIDKTKGKSFGVYEGMSELVQFEPAFTWVPEYQNLLNAIAWTSENIKRLEKINNKSK